MLFFLEKNKWKNLYSTYVYLSYANISVSKKNFVYIRLKPDTAFNQLN